MGVGTAGMDDDKAAKVAVEAIMSLGEQIGAPHHMADVGVEKEAIPRMAADAIQSAHIACNPRPVKESDLIELYTMAF
jgi:alcohol dehydrogenase class IV